MPLKVLLAGFRQVENKEFIDALLNFNEIEVTSANTGRDVLEILSRNCYDLAIVSQTLGSIDSLQLARKLVKHSPMTNCAVSNSLPPDVFHEQSEGLGLLAQLPAAPGADDARELIQKAIQIKALMKLS